jgi:hypothetical protein
MKLYYLFFPLLLLFLSCSGNEESNPVNTEETATGFVRGTINGSNWYSSEITTSKSGNTRTVKAIQNITNDPIFSSSVIELKISVSQSGKFGIGENEPGFTYYVKAYYTLVSRSGNQDENYKAYFDNISFMTINRISDKDLDASFNFNARNDDSTKTISLSSGSVVIDF